MDRHHNGNKKTRQHRKKMTAEPIFDIDHLAKRVCLRSQQKKQRSRNNCRKLFSINVGNQRTEVFQLS